MKIAMIGIRGVPANYSGLETCAEEVGVRLVERGHEVIVYCRNANYDEREPQYEGIKRIFLPGARSKFVDTLVHSARAMLHARKNRPDVILAFNPAVSSLCVIAKSAGIPLCLNPDGFDWRRPKWPLVGRFFIYLSAWLSGKVIDQLTVDAVSVRDYYAEHFGCKADPMYIPNGANLEAPQEDDPVDEVLAQYGLKRNQYILFLSRHVEDNSCKEIIEAYEGLDTKMPLFFGGGAAYANPYADSLTNTKDERVKFPGSIYDPEHVRILHHHCNFLVHGNKPGGTSLGLLKAMGLGTCVMTLDTPDNAYVIKEAGRKYQLSPESIRQTMQYLIDHPDQVVAYRKKAVERIKEEYLWDVVTDKYESAFRKAIACHGTNSGKECAIE